MLKDEEPDEKKYQGAQEIYEVFKCRNMGDYNKIYNVMDVINLMKIFEENTKILQKQLHYNVKNFSSMSSYAAACAMFKDRSICFNIDSKQILDAVENTVHGGLAHVYTRRSIKSDIDKELMEGMYRPQFCLWMKITCMVVKCAKHYVKGYLSRGKTVHRMMSMSSWNPITRTTLKAAWYSVISTYRENITTGMNHFTLLFSH